MTADKSNSIHLPGSGTVGIEQLSVLSNIRLPGIWLYRIDEETVSQCMHSVLQPPYCDAPSPTLINSRRPTTTTQLSLINNQQIALKSTNMFKSIESKENNSNNNDENEENSSENLQPFESKKLKNKNNHHNSMEAVGFFSILKIFKSLH